MGFMYFYRPININLSADLSDYIKDITRRMTPSTKSVLKIYNRPTVAEDKWRATIGRSSADDRPTVGGHIGRYVAHSNYDIDRSSPDHRPIAKTPKVVNYNKVVILYFLSADEKRAKIWHFIGR